MELLRNLRSSTRLLFLYEVTTNRHTRLRTIAERLGMTVQGASEYAHGLQGDGLLVLANGEYRATKKGVELLHDGFLELRRFVERAGRAMAFVETTPGSRPRGNSACGLGSSLASCPQPWRPPNGGSMSSCCSRKSGSLKPSGPSKRRTRNSRTRSATKPSPYDAQRHRGRRQAKEERLGGPSPRHDAGGLPMTAPGIPQAEGGEDRCLRCGSPLQSMGGGHSSIDTASGRPSPSRAWPAATR